MYNLIRGIVVVSMILFYALATAKPQEKQYVGAATCGTSSCHAASKPWANSSIQQNEHNTWQSFDRHAQAFNTLLSEKSKRIAYKLRIGAPHRSPTCLTCHSTHAPKHLQSRNYSHADGVSCEGCHGAASQYLGPHVASKTTHAQNIASGMNNLALPSQRAEVCGDCHTINSKKFINHQLMGAGHPRLRFELRNYTLAQPMHAKIDDDYMARKGVHSPVETWVAGQLVASKQLMEAYLVAPGSHQKIFPELAFYDCKACHQSIKKPTGKPAKRKTAIPSNKSNLIMMQAIASAIAPSLTQELEENIEQFDLQLAGKRAEHSAAKQIKLTAERLIEIAQRRAPTLSQLKDLNAALVLATQDANNSGLLFAEQAVMAMNAILDEAKQQTGETSTSHYELLEQLYQAADHPESYVSADFLAAFQQLQTAIQPVLAEVQ